MQPENISDITDVQIIIQETENYFCLLFFPYPQAIFCLHFCALNLKNIGSKKQRRPGTN